jgi:hypothetical protein
VLIKHEASKGDNILHIGAHNIIAPGPPKIGIYVLKEMVCKTPLAKYWLLA